MSYPKISVKEAVKAIDARGILLTFPIDNRKEFPSIWDEFFPKSKMRWEWDSGGDDRVANLWRLREELSRSGKVVYAKWFKGRATFFSKAVFVDILAALGTIRTDRRHFTPEARLLLETLESDSPLSTKQLKLATDLRGKLYERAYEKAMKSLWERLLIVGYGELDDGAFPSLMVGATRHIFESLWEEAAGRDPDAAWAELEKKLGSDSEFWRFLEKTRAKLRKN